jgi:NAD(P)-dependent dehydrogenase (short-subunit alcohol dehydrogenase family)
MEMPMSLAETTLVLIGEPNDLMRATARQAEGHGARVVLGVPIGTLDEDTAGVPEVHRLDLQEEEALQNFFEAMKSFDHAVVFQSLGIQGVQWELDTPSARSGFDEIFWFPFMAAKRAGPHLTERGSLTFVCASSTRRPMKGMSVVGAANGALEALASVLAVEMAPRRVNVINPGLYLQAANSEEVHAVKEGKVGNIVPGLLAPGVDQAENIARTVLHLANDAGITGSVVDAAVLMRGCCTADVSGWVTIGGC